MANPAAVAYEAYRDYFNTYVNDWGAYLLRWKDLSDEQQLAWWAVVHALAAQRAASRAEGGEK